MGCESSAVAIEPHDQNQLFTDERSPESLPKQTKVTPDEPAPVAALHEDEFKRAQRLEKEKKHNQAIELYLTMQENSTHIAEVCAGLGNCYRFKNKYDESIKWSLKSFSLKNNEIACNSLAIVHRVKKDFLTAKEWCLKGKEINPNYAYVHATLGSIYIELKERDNAIISYKKAIEVDPTFELAYSRLSEIYSKTKEYNIALEWLNKLVEITPDNEQTYFDIALIYKNELRNQEQALKFLAKAIEKNPKFSVAYNTTGNIYNDKKDYAKSEIYFKKSIEYDPKYAYPQNGLGNSFYGRKMYKQSIDCYLKAIEIDPKYATPYSGVGDSYKQIGELSKAIQAYNKSIELNPTCGNPYNGLGNVYKAKGDCLQSIKWCKKCIEVDPRNEHPYNGIGNALKDLQQYDEALTYYKKAIEVNPKYNYPYNGIANIYNERRNIPEAQIWYKKCMDLDPTYDRPYNNLGNLYYNNNRLEDAKKLYIKTLEINPKSESACNGLGLTFVSEGKYEQALKYYYKGIEANPLYSLIYINCALCLIKIENYPQAFRILKEAKRIINTAQIDVFGGCRNYVTNQLQQFQNQIQQWEFKLKKGYLNPIDKQRIQKLREDFEAKIKAIFQISNDGNSSLNPKDLDINFLNILTVIQKDEFKMENSADIAKLDFELFKANMDNFNIMAYIFCKFFWIEKRTNKHSIGDIEKKLEAKIDQLTQIYPPSNSTANEVTVVHLKREVPEKRINLFKKVQYFEDYRYLVKEIEAIHERSKLVLPKFKEFVYKICSDFKGYHSKANLKLPEKESERFKVYIRIMEKMFKEIKTKKAQIIDKIEKKIDEGAKSSMALVISYLIDVWSEEINGILKQRTKEKEPTSCEITDFVRGKAMFKSVEDIVAAANQLIDESDAAGFEITEIDNRLGKETKDLVFKIMIDGIVCEFQMALENDSNQYNFSHSFYEIRRSPMGCVFGSFLFLSKFQVLSFFKDAKEIYNYFKDKTLNPKDASYMIAAKYLVDSFEQQA